MIVLIQRRDMSDQWLMTGVERIEENDDLDIVLISDHSEPVVVYIGTHRLDVVGVG
jgi:hypothetical protein